MARTFVQHEKGMGAFLSGVVVGTDGNGDAVMVVALTGAPTNGTTLAGEAGIGSLIIRTDNGTLYQNTGTKASPTWTAR